MLYVCVSCFESIIRKKKPRISACKSAADEEARSVWGGKKAHRKISGDVAEHQGHKYFMIWEGKNSILYQLASAGSSFLFRTEIHWIPVSVKWIIKHRRTHPEGGDATLDGFY